MQNDELRQAYWRIRTDLRIHAKAFTVDRSNGGTYLNNIYKMVDDIGHGRPPLSHIFREWQATRSEPQIPPPRGGNMKPSRRSKASDKPSRVRSI